MLVVYADAPLVTAASLTALRQALADGADLAALAFEAANPTGYGRMIERDGRLVAIREEKDATAAERAIRRCNAGPMAIRGAHALALLDAVGCDNAQKEFYLTDLAEIAAGRGLKAETRLAAEEEAMGVNDRLQLAAAEAAMQRRLRRKAMLEGATLVAPETVFLSADAAIGRDVTIEPHVVIGAGVTIGDGAVIHAFSHLEGAKVAGGAAIGPYARLRPGADIAAKAKVGNFVEIKAVDDRGRRQGQPSDLHRRRAGRRRDEHRRRNDHLQLRRLRQIQDRHRRRRLHRLQFGAGRAGQDRRRRLCRLRLGDHQGRRSRRARRRARPPGGEARLGQGVPARG